ncbi:hypothetical protein [Janthinobacterium sp. GW456P]|uniref:hypothetical protein n=1 Tax=Janthinobacterium sp. GW456P TaxID=1981506 RepID=UPI0015579E98|nr:hypothetical protein [Janthinobacterium sp. GW456P]
MDLNHARLPIPPRGHDAAFAAFLLSAACSAATDKIIRVGGDSVNEHFALFFKKPPFPLKKAFLL